MLEPAGIGNHYFILNEDTTALSINGDNNQYDFDTQKTITDFTKSPHPWNKCLKGVDSANEDDSGSGTDIYELTNARLCHGCNSAGNQCTAPVNAGNYKIKNAGSTSSMHLEIVDPPATIEQEYTREDFCICLEVSTNFVVMPTPADICTDPFALSRITCFPHNPTQDGAINKFGNFEYMDLKAENV